MYESQAESIAELIRDENKTLDPIVITVILEIIGAIVQKCILNKKKINNPGIIDKMYLWNYVKRSCRFHNIKPKSVVIYDAFLQRGTVMKDEEVETLLNKGK